MCAFVCDLSLLCLTQSKVQTDVSSQRCMKTTWTEKHQEGLIVSIRHTHTHHSSDRNVFTNPTHTCRVFVNLTSTEFKHYQIFPHPFLKACHFLTTHSPFTHSWPHTHTYTRTGRCGCVLRKIQVQHYWCTMDSLNATSNAATNGRGFKRERPLFSSISTNATQVRFIKTSHQELLRTQIKNLPPARGRFSHLLGGSRSNRFSRAGGDLQRGALKGSEEGGGT